jgi:hypothetical protein
LETRAQLSCPPVSASVRAELAQRSVPRKMWRWRNNQHKGEHMPQHNQFAGCFGSPHKLSSCAGKLCRGIDRAYNIGRADGGRHDAERPTLSGDAQSARSGRPALHHHGRGPCGAGAACAPRLPTIHPPPSGLSVVSCLTATAALTQQVRPPCLGLRLLRSLRACGAVAPQPESWGGVSSGAIDVGTFQR